MVMTVIGDLGCTTVGYSGRLNDNEYAYLGGDTNFNAGAGLTDYKNEITVPIACTLLAVGYSQDFTGNFLRIFVNGGSDQDTSTTSSSRGAFTLTKTALAPGDTVAIQNQSAAGDVIWYLALSFEGTMYQFGADITVGGNTFTPYEHAETGASGGAAAPASDIYSIHVAKSGTLRYLTLNYQNTGGNVEIWVDGVLEETVTVSGTSDFLYDLFEDFGITVPLLEGQTLSLAATSSPDEAQIQAWVV
jgi:hypothetical protein